MSSADPQLDGRPRLVVAVTYPIVPPLGGGQVRAYHLYGGLASRFDIEFVALGASDASGQRVLVAPGVSERCIPKSARHAELELELEREAGTAVTDVAMAELYRHTPDYLAALESATQGAHAVVACHPYVFPALREVTNLPLWYEAQDVEATLKRQVLSGTPLARRLAAAAERVERECCLAAEMVWACSAEDARELTERYALAPDRVVVVPNGAALDETAYVDQTRRREHRRRLCMERSLAVFIASWHEPNVVGARRLLRVAPRVPEMDVLIVGSVGMALAGELLPRNVSVTGTVSLGFKQAVLAIADLALNPVTTGSGTNLKMLDYFAAGVPVISTAFGARGLGVRPGEHYLPAEPPGFPAALKKAARGNSHKLDAIASSARRLVESRMSWDVISRELLAEIDARGRLSGRIAVSAGRARRLEERPERVDGND